MCTSISSSIQPLDYNFICKACEQHAQLGCVLWVIRVNPRGAIVLLH